MVTCLILVATLGFDADLVLRRIREIRSPKRLICFALKVDEQNFKRVESAFELIRFISEKMGFPSELKPFTAESGLIRSIKVELERLAFQDDVELNLTGGPRILIVASLIAALLLPENIAKGIYVRIAGERFEAELKTRLTILKALTSLDNDEREILELITEKEQATVTEIAKDINIPKSTVYKKVRKIAEKSLVELINRHTGEKYTVSRELLDLLY